MKTHHLLELFGHSIYHPELNDELIKFGINCKNKEELERYDSLKSKSHGVTFTFWFKEFYSDMIGIPKSTYKPKSSEEVILFEMTFKGSSSVFPFGLKKGNSTNEVIDKIGFKPSSKSKNLGKENLWNFYSKEFKVMPVFNKKMKLKWLRIWKLDKSDRIKIELKKNLKLQNKNIKPENHSKLEKFKAENPIPNWERKNSKKSISDLSIFVEANLCIEEFIVNLINATKNKNANKVQSSVKKVTKKFNKLSLRESHLINTPEREKLINFIMMAVKLTGFEVENEIDLTQDWRNW